MSLPSEYGAPVAVVASNVVPVGGSVQAGQSAAAVNPILTGRLDGSNNLQPDSCIENVTLLASAARTAQVVSAAQVNHGFRGVLLYVNCTAASGTGGLTPYLQAYDLLSAQWVGIGAFAKVVTAVGLWAALWYPVNNGNPFGYTSLLPANWRIQIEVGDASSYTYSVSADLLF